MSKSITREQVNAINAKMSNGFQLDVCSLTLYGEKKAVKSIKLDDATTLVATLTFAASYDKKRNTWGQKFNVPNGKSHVALNLSIWHCNPGADITTSRGLGWWMNVSEDMPRRNFSAIQKLTANYDDDTIMTLFAERTANYDDDTIMILFGEKQRDSEMIRAFKGWRSQCIRSHNGKNDC